MESLTLLSSLSLGYAIPRTEVQPDRAAPSFVKVSLTGGYITGLYVFLTTPKTATYLTTSGTVHGVKPLQNATVTGSIVYNHKGLTATSLKSANLTMTVGTKNAITVTLTLPKGSNPNTQYAFNYKLTKATGEFKGNKESGRVTFERFLGSFTADFT